MAESNLEAHGVISGTPSPSVGSRAIRTKAQLSSAWTRLVTISAQRDLFLRASSGQAVPFWRRSGSTYGK
jgi:hypothetical protein